MLDDGSLRWKSLSPPQSQDKINPTAWTGSKWLFFLVSGAQDSLNTQFKILESTVVRPIGIRTGVCQSSLRPGARGTVLTHASWWLPIRGSKDFFLLQTRAATALLATLRMGSREGKPASQKTGLCLWLCCPRPIPTSVCLSLYKLQSFHKLLFCLSQQGYVLFTMKTVDRYEKGSISRKEDLEEKQIIWECQNPEEIPLLQPDWKEGKDFMSRINEGLDEWTLEGAINSLPDSAWEETLSINGSWASEVNHEDLCENKAGQSQQWETETGGSLGFTSQPPQSKQQASDQWETLGSQDNGHLWPPHIHVHTCIHMNICIHAHALPHTHTHMHTC